ncbi:MAG: glycosyltransferase family 2 protein [Flavobacteriales bacterium]|jgi:glycosyltransferase involved in cell wall biosynthesis|nr:MAG: glycosyltransferase family 2 protein [Flavobacteriales bacterium]
MSRPVEPENPEGAPAPLVSISVTAHRHEAYLAQCLESILMQECPFAYEVLLSEDDSGDGTRAIAQRYAEANPDRIRLFLHRRDQLIRIDGRPTGRHSLLHNLSHARGRYLCHIDGDDYWTDRDRLRVMVEKMEAEPDLGLAFHNAWNEWDDGRRQVYLAPSIAKPRYSRSDLTAVNFIPTAGVIWRWNALRVLPDAFQQAPFGDWVINIHFAGLGPIGYVDRFMAVRRVHEGGAMSAMGTVRTCRSLALAYEVMRTQVGEGLSPVALARWTKQVTDGFDLALKAGDRDHARWFLAHAAAVPQGNIPRRTRLRWWALLHWPRLMRAYASIRRH